LGDGERRVPRATNDVDVNVFVDVEALGRVFAALRSLGIVVDDAAARHGANEEGPFIADAALSSLSDHLRQRR
jgi:hypothetical protein